MNNLVVTLETAKKLKAAGFLQKAYWYWLYGIDESGDAVLCDGDLNEYQIRIGDPQERAESEYAAPTAQEIADQLPEHLEDKLYGYYLTIGADEGWQASYIESLEEPKIWTEIYACRADTMAEALALLWLKLNNQGVDHHE